MLYQKPKRVRKLQRLRHHDYMSAGWYFITICTKYMMQWFGDIINDQMMLNKCGEIVKQQLLWLPKQYPYIRLDKWVIMPNHIHVIIQIQPYAIVVVGNGRDRSLHRNQKSLPSLIGAFKTTSSKRIHQETLNRQFVWHKSYHDHVIQNTQALLNIRRYIINNPKKWYNHCE